MPTIQFSEEEWNMIARKVSILLGTGSSTTPTPLPNPPTGGSNGSPSTPPVQQPTGSLSRFDTAPSQWSKWKFWQSSEFEPMVQRMMNQNYTRPMAEQYINTQINHWGPYAQPQGRMTKDGMGNYHYYFERNYIQEEDVGQADAYAKELQPFL